MSAVVRCDSVARAFQPELRTLRIWWPEWLVFGVTVPLTPDPSPPFHGGEGGLVVSDQWSEKLQTVCLTRSREAAKPRRETQGTVFGVRCSLRRVTDGSPRVFLSGLGLSSPGHGLSSLLSQYLFHGSTFGQFIDQFVKIADLAHQRIFDLFNPHSADDSPDQRAVGIQ